MLAHLKMSKENSGVPRISRDSITGSDMPSALGLVDFFLRVWFDNDDVNMIGAVCDDREYEDVCHYILWEGDNDPD